MLKVRMSLLRVSLLAITLAAITAHAARSEQSLTSAAESLRRENSGLIPWTECHKTCDHCACTKMWPPESNWCSCSNDPAPKKASAVAIQPRVNSFNPVLFPCDECNENCNSVCLVNPIWPPPKYCTCADPIVPASKLCSEDCQLGGCVCDPPQNCSCSTATNHSPLPAAVAVQQVPNLNAVLFPREECDENCNFYCACLLIWPPPKYCSCGDPILPAAKLCSENCQEGCVCDPPENCTCITADESSKGEAVLIPYDECEEKCNVACACALIWPPPKYCSCGDPKVNSLSKKAAAVAVQQVPKLKGSSPLMSVSECIQSCNGVCGCGLIFPPHTDVCYCFDTVKSSKKAAAEQVPNVKLGVLFPREECNDKCNVQCACAAIYPPPAYCSCGDPKALSE